MYDALHTLFHSECSGWLAIHVILAATGATVITEKVIAICRCDVITALQCQHGTDILSLVI